MDRATPDRVNVRISTPQKELTLSQRQFISELVRQAQAVQARWGTFPTAIEIPSTVLIENQLEGLVGIMTMQVIPVESIPGTSAPAFIFPNDRSRWPDSGVHLYHW